MMIVYKYDGERYVIVEIEDGDYKPSMMDMEEKIKCPSCGKMVAYGDCYTSKEYYFPGGVFGLNVCPECHVKERRNKKIRG